MSVSSTSIMGQNAVAEKQELRPKDLYFSPCKPLPEIGLREV